MYGRLTITGDVQRAKIEMQSHIYLIVHRHDLTVEYQSQKELERKFDEADVRSVLKWTQDLEVQAFYCEMSCIYGSAESFHIDMLWPADHSICGKCYDFHLFFCHTCFVQSEISTKCFRLYDERCYINKKSNQSHNK